MCSGCRFACNMTLWFDIFSSGGVGRTGVFCGISMMIERVKAEGVIDVFQTVQAMRLQRPAMVQTAVRLSINVYCFLFNTINITVNDLNPGISAVCLV